jgi:hypothetical protein
VIGGSFRIVFNNIILKYCFVFHRRLIHMYSWSTNGGGSWLSSILSLSHCCIDLLILTLHAAFIPFCLPYGWIPLLLPFQVSTWA